MQEKSNSTIQKIAQYKAISDLLYRRLVIFTLLLYFFPTVWRYYVVTACYSFDNVSWQTYYPFKDKMHFAIILTLFLGVISVIRILLEILFRLYYFLQKRHIVSSDMPDFPTIRSLTECAEISGRAAYLRFLKIMVKLVPCLFGLYIIITWIPCILFLISEAKKMPDLTFKGFLLGTSFILFMISMVPITVCIIITLFIKSDYNKLLTKHLRIYSNAANNFNSLLGVNVDSLSGIGFERYCADLLLQLGYKNISFTKASHDQGIDLIAFKNGYKYGIQCKCYRYPVGNKAVQEVVAGLQMYNCQKAIVMTNSHFTKDAISLAKANRVQLIDRKELYHLIQTVVIHSNQPDSK